MSTTSKWSGYGASLFSILCFGEGMAYALAQGDLPDWFAILTGTCFLLAALSGAVCLSAAGISYLRRKHQTSSSGGTGELQRGAV